jgi:hypothetical protein
MMYEFTDSDITNLVTNHNWELVLLPNGRCILQQKDQHYMKTVEFYTTNEIVSKFCSNGE